MAARLQEVPATTRDSTSEATCRRLTAMREVQRGPLAAYAATALEIALEAVIAAAWRRGQAVYLPRWHREHRSYEMVSVAAETKLRTGRMGISEPPAGLGAIDDATRRRDLVWLVPGLAFDRSGTRLGHGGGHYDRLLRGVTGLRIAIAYDWQIVTELPRQAHDVPVSRLVTDTQVIEFESA